MSDSLPLQLSQEKSRLSGFLLSLVCVIAVRAIVVSVGIISIVTAGPRMQLGNTAGDPWVAWDGLHYLEILLNGYASSKGAPHWESIAFFPLFPLAARLLSAFMTPPTAMVVLANVCTLVGFGFLYAWARKLADVRAAVICLLVAATYPGAVFFSAGMTEGPFFMFVAITLWLLQCRYFWTAAMVTAVATLTRPTGATLAIIVALYTWFSHPHLPFWKRAGLFIAIGFASALGGMLYQLFLWHRFGDFGVYFAAQQTWSDADQKMVSDQAAQGVARYSLRFFIDHLTAPSAWNRGLALIVLGVTLAGIYKPGRIPRVLFMLPLLIFLMTWLPNKGLRTSSIVRYESAAIPLYLIAGIWLAQIKRRPAMYALLVAMLVMQIYYAVLFSRGIWVG